MIQLILTGQHPNISSEQSFESESDLRTWLSESTLLVDVVLDLENNIVNFKGGNATITYGNND